MTLIVYEKRDRQKRSFLKGILEMCAIMFLSLLLVFQAKAEAGPHKNVPGSKMGTYKEAGFFKTVTGTVTDESGNPVAGAAISVNGSKSGIITASDGSFTIEANEGDELVISHISYLSQTVKVGQANYITITLQLNINNLEQVVITDYTEYSKVKAQAPPG